MKAEDLMLFDLVKRRKDSKIMTVVELRYAETVAAITPDDIYYGDMEDYHENEIDPIPLTTAILEKNFVSSDNTFGLKNYELGQDYILEDRGNRFGLVRLFPGHRYSTSHICDICHVHQLQHALRLCGIDKEIVIC